MPALLVKLVLGVFVFWLTTRIVLDLRKHFKRIEKNDSKRSKSTKKKR